MRFVIVWGLAAVMLGALASNAAADVGPPDPARQVCMGAPDGAACSLDGKSGTCHGPHPSRMYCQTDKPPAAPVAPDDGKSAVGSGSATPAGSAAPAAESAPSPGHKRGCAVSDAGSASLVGLAIVALGLRRRRSRPAA